MNDLKKLEEKEHHIYGGSSAKYWVNCHGWASLMEQYYKENGEDVAGPAAEKGTALHTGILERKCVSEIEFLRSGNRIPIDYSDIPLWPIEGPEMADDFWNNFFTETLESFVTGKVIYIEKKLMLNTALDAGGTGDCVILYHNDKGQLVGVVGDLKTGRVRVEPDDEQLLFYLAALYLRVKEKGKDIEIFKSFVYQPSHTEVYTDHVFTKAKVISAVKKYEKAILASKAPKPKLKVGDWCTYCKVKSMCPAYSADIGRRMDLAVMDNQLPAIETTSDDVLLRQYHIGTKLEDDLSKYMSALRKHIIQRYIAGKPLIGTSELQGLKIVGGVTKRKWKDDILAESTLVEYGIDPTKRSIIGIGDAEKLLKATGKQKKEVDEIMYTLTEKPNPPPKITTLDDKREPLALNSGVNLLIGLDEDSE